MKKIALFTGLCAIASGVFAQNSSVVIIPAFQNRFAGIHQPIVALNTINTRSAFETRSFGGSTYIADPAARGVVTSPTAAATTRGRLDATTMNIPVFPGNTALMLQQQAVGFGGMPFATFPANAGFGGNTGFFIQQGGGSSLQQVDPFRTTATPGPAVNAVPNPAAPVPTIPQLQVSPNPTIPVQQPNPVTIVPGVPVQTGPTATGQGNR